MQITSQRLLLGSLQLAYAGRHMGKFVRAFHSLFRSWNEMKSFRNVLVLVL